MRCILRFSDTTKPIKNPNVIAHITGEYVSLYNQYKVSMKSLVQQVVLYILQLHHFHYVSVQIPICTQQV